MKNIMLVMIVAFVGFSFPSWGQSPAVKEFYEKYKSLDKVTDVHLKGWVLKLASEFSDDEAGERLLKKITQLRVLIMEEGNLVSPVEYKQLLKQLKRDQFEELFHFKEKQKSQAVSFYLREKGDAVTDVIVLVSGQENFVLLSLEGALRFSDLNDLRIDVDGAEHFKKLPEKKSSIPQA